MMKLHKFVVMILAFAGSIASINSYALGLGDVKLHSTLNQPLVAEIELTQVNNLSESEILPNLASKSDFERAGLVRPFILNKLQFTTVIGPSGKGFIKVTSKSPIHEPYINFLVEVHWPSGRLLKEYTLLIDPPTFNGQVSQPVIKPSVVPPHYGNTHGWDQPIEQNHTPVISYYPTDPDDNEPHALQRQQLPDRSFSSTDRIADSPGTYRVNKNDSLWEIANQVRPDSSVTVQQTMLAIQRRNPQAFINDNINHIRSGQVLRIPNRNEINRLTVHESVTEVARQNREWTGRSQQFQPLNTTRTNSSDYKENKRFGDDKLAIVSGNTGTDNGKDYGWNDKNHSSKLKNELAITREQLDDLSRENAELKSRLNDLDDQITTLKRLISVKDNQIAAIQNQTASDPQKPEHKKNIPGMNTKPSAVDILFGSSLLLFMIALIPIIGVGWLFFQRRKQKQSKYAEGEDTVEVETNFPETELDTFDDNEEKDSIKKSVVTPSLNDQLKFDEALSIDDPLTHDLDEDEETTQQTEDPLSEADIYIGYGRLNQAEQLLAQAIKKEPTRSDLKLKMLEVHSEEGNLEKFKNVLSDIEALGDASAMSQANTYKTKFPDAFQDLPDIEQNDTQNIELDELGLNDNDQEEESLENLDFDLDDFESYEEDNDPSQFEEKEADILNDLHDLDDLDDLDLDLNPENDKLGQDSQAAFSQDGGSTLESALDDELELLSESDEVATKLDLAKAYMDMGDKEGATEILQEVIEQGNDEQKQEAIALLGN